MKFDVIVADPPWDFKDKLKQSDVKRGAASQYDLIKNKDIPLLDVKSIAKDNCVLALWVPSSLLKEGIQTLEGWGFKLKQTHIWVKTKNNPFKMLLKGLKKQKTAKEMFTKLSENLDSFRVDDVLNFYMGHIFRQTHEIVLIGTRGKVSKMLKNRAQRSVHFGTVTEHSKKPEALQDMLDIMYPNTNKVELFARRDRIGYTCVGNECPTSLGEDIRDSLIRLKNSS